MAMGENVCRHHGCDALSFECALTENFIFALHDSRESIHCAAFVGHAGLVHLLARYGADPCTTDSDGIAPLHWAAAGNQLETVQALVDSGADVNQLEGTETARVALDYAQLGDGTTPFTELVTYLQAQGARSSAEDWQSLDTHLAATRIQAAWRGHRVRRNRQSSSKPSTAKKRKSVRFSRTESTSSRNLETRALRPRGAGPTRAPNDSRHSSDNTTASSPRTSSGSRSSNLSPRSSVSGFQQESGGARRISVQSPRARSQRDSQQSGPLSPTSLRSERSSAQVEGIKGKTAALTEENLAHEQSPPVCSPDSPTRQVTSPGTKASRRKRRSKADAAPTASHSTSANLSEEKAEEASPPAPESHEDAEDPASESLVPAPPSIASPEVDEVQKTLAALRVRHHHMLAERRRREAVYQRVRAAETIQRCWRRFNLDVHGCLPSRHASTLRQQQDTRVSKIYTLKPRGTRSYRPKPRGPVRQHTSLPPIQTPVVRSMNSAIKTYVRQPAPQRRRPSWTPASTMS
ncbi:uncharacterized protein MONBRDRAFT_9584 [Monosiga brevicollis MX1]|uniref:Uncharacterized protein n=1 Tax=Monosiga brevicollis TaxID=81824 RepID=A9V3S0_MONBE|nr:uncharacterized protein MONBRDRAFT_9584 [Monosiga brevicollis MX1]EDQ87859.1 predicted protein [Monosiga brevicollis MX1]|eukprot:XP_001747392.1 hypothetical protein [Monosiga brevicollis MX1]